MSKVVHWNFNLWTTEVHIRSIEVKKDTIEVETKEQTAFWKISETTTEVKIRSTEVSTEVEIRSAKVS